MDNLVHYLPAKQVQHYVYGASTECGKQPQGLRTTQYVGQATCPACKQASAQGQKTYHNDRAKALLEW